MQMILKGTMVLNVKVRKQQLAEKRHLSKGVKVFTTTRDRSLIHI